MREMMSGYFSTSGVQNLGLGGANAPPFRLREALFYAALRRNSLNDTQGGARVCIVKRV